MRSSLRLFLALCASVLPSLSLRGYTPTEDGLYAVFDTSAGQIVAELYYLRVPVMVGNFMRLAEGTAQTLDIASGTIRQEPFYDGLTFHRVDDPYGIVGGSPGGTVGGGPGYYLPNEIFFLDGSDFWKYSFNEAGRLAMLDTGFNANGSQFFITTEAEPLSGAPEMFGKHSVFGEIVEGMEVVLAIEAAPRSGDTPINPVVINGISFVREGAAAEAFNPLQPTSGTEVPHIETIAPEFRWKDASEMEFAYSWEPWSYHYFYSSKQLDSWQNIGVSNLNSGATMEATFTRPWAAVSDAGRLFVRGVRVQGNTPLSSQLVGRTLQVAPTGEDPIRLHFEEDFQGTYTIYHHANETEYTGNISAWRAWLTGSSIQIVVQFSTLVVATGDDTFLVTQPQQIYLYFSASGQPLATFTHVLGTDAIYDDSEGELIVGALPAANLPGVWDIWDTETE